MEIIHKRKHVSEDVAEPEKSIESVDRVYEDAVPLFKNVLIKKGAREATWGDAHILIPDYVQKAPNMGAVVAKSKWWIVGSELKPLDDEMVKVGDLVTFSMFNTEDVNRDAEDYLLCSVYDLKLIERVTFALGVSHARGL